jgi:hypothetical protein
MTDSSRSVAGLPAENDCPPSIYDRTPSHHGMIAEMVSPCRCATASTCLSNIYRPDSTEKFLALLSFSIYNEDTRLISESG